MSKTQRWLALVIALALLVGTLAATTAFAMNGDNNLDLPGEPSIEPPLEYGDPDPGGGSPMHWGDFRTWKQILLASLRIRFGVPVEPACTVESGSAISPLRACLGKSK